MITVLEQAKIEGEVFVQLLRQLPEPQKEFISGIMQGMIIGKELAKESKTA